MTEAQKKSYDLAAEVTKELLALAAGTLVLGATFLHDAGEHPMGARLVVASYIALFGSCAAGIRTLYGLASVLASIQSTSPLAVPVVTRVPMIRRSAAAQYGLFGVGIALLALFGLLRLL